LAQRRVALVVDVDRNAIHIQAQGISEEHQHHQRLHQRGHQASGVANDVEEFLTEHRARAPPVHAFTSSLARCFASCSIRPTKTSSMVGLIGSSRVTSSPAFSSAARTSPAALEASSTFTCRPAPNTATSATPGTP